MPPRNNEWEKKKGNYNLFATCRMLRRLSSMPSQGFNPNNMEQIIMNNIICNPFRSANPDCNQRLTDNRHIRVLDIHPVPGTGNKPDRLKWPLVD